MTENVARKGANAAEIARKGAKQQRAQRFLDRSGF